MALTLDAYLDAQVGIHPLARQAGETVRHLADAAVELHRVIGEGGTAGDGNLGRAHGGRNADGDVQKELDVVADRVFGQAAKAAPIAFFGSEEQDEPVALDEGAPLAIAIDPLDGSSNIATNVSVGTIFSLLPVEDAHRADPASIFRQPGSKQAGAGFFVYGPQLLLVLTLGKGAASFLFSPSKNGFVALDEAIEIAPEAGEFSVNIAYHRHWDEPVRRYVDDLMAGADGPRGRDFSMRYVGSMVADAYRILQRGGVFLYPGDRRKGYGKGRLRLLYEASPVAFVVEQAGGKASDGRTRILDIVPDGLHVRTPFVFGSAEEVDAARRYAAD